MGTGLQKFSNGASATLAAGISSTATSLSVTSGEGAEFPALAANQFFVATIMHLSGTTVTAFEIVTVTARATDSMTIVRGQEGTAAAAWAAGDTIALLPTAGGMGQMVQPVQAQAQGYNYAADTGSANAYVVGLTPALTAHVEGMPIVFLAAHTNTGASTFNDGVAADPLVLPGGANLPASTIIGGYLYISMWNGSEFELIAGGADAQLATILSDLSVVASLSAAVSTLETQVGTLQAGVGSTAVSYVTTDTAVAGASVAIGPVVDVVDGAVYKFIYEGDVVTTGGVGSLETSISGGTAAGGGGLCQAVDTANSVDTVYANGASATFPGGFVAGTNTTRIIVRGEFTATGATAQLEMSLSSGSMTVKAGGSAVFTRID